MRAPLFTVIMTTYNRRDLIPQAIQSVLNQTFKDYELLVIDNGSTDGTEEVVQEIRDPRLKYIRNPNPTTSCEAPRNLGIQMARGSLISFLDDDEQWYPERLEKVKRAFEENGDISVVCHNQNIRVNDKIDGQWRAGASEGDIFETLLYERTCLVAGATTIKTECLRELGGFVLRKEYDAASDYDLWLRLARKNVKIHFIDEFLGEFSITGRNLSIVDPAFGARVAFLIKEHILEYEKKPIFLISKKGMLRLFQLYFIAGRSFIKAGHYKNALSYYLRAVFFIIVRPSLIFNLFSKLTASR